MKDSKQIREELLEIYSIRKIRALDPIAKNLLLFLQDLFSSERRIDRISVRVKAADSFIKKAMKQREGGGSRYVDPISEIQDQIGARIVCFYSSDVGRIVEKAKLNFRHVEDREVFPSSDSEFGYFGTHLILFVPTDVCEDHIERESIPKFFELQVKTLFQHAWSEADHDLAYKPGDLPLTSLQKRKVALTAAQAWGADHVFDELFRERLKTNDN
jgi:putative GTP pyrophosphokinase